MKLCAERHIAVYQKRKEAGADRTWEMQSSSYYQGSEKETASKPMEGEGTTHIVTHSLAPR